MRPFFFSFCLLVLVMFPVGCGGDGSFSATAKMTGDESFALDLASAQVTPQGNDLSVGSATRLMFRRVAATRSVNGRYPLDNWAEADERSITETALNEYFIATTELSQEQWTAMAKEANRKAPALGLVETPWLGLVEDSGVTSERLVGPARPAVGMTRVEVEAAYLHCSPLGWRLRLPTPAEWEHAALAGASTRFAWGDAQGDVEVQQYANVWLLNAPSLVRSQDVGKLLPNVFGLRDMHGNVWEMTADVTGPTFARGGAWDQPVLQARASNRLTIPADAGLPTVGVRLVLVRE